MPIKLARTTIKGVDIKHTTSKEVGRKMNTKKIRSKDGKKGKRRNGIHS